MSDLLYLIILHLLLECDGPASLFKIQIIAGCNKATPGRRTPKNRGTPKRAPCLFYPAFKPVGATPREFDVDFLRLRFFAFELSITSTGIGLLTALTVT